MSDPSEPWYDRAEEIADKAERVGPSQLAYNIASLVQEWAEKSRAEGYAAGEIAMRERAAAATAGRCDPASGLHGGDYDPYAAYNRGWVDGVSGLRVAIRALASGKEQP